MAVFALAVAVAPAAAVYRLPTSSGARTSFANDEDFLDYVQRQTFQYFWDTQHPVTGLVPDRASNPQVCSIAAVGFGLSSVNVAVARGWVTRADARARVRRTLEFLLSLPQGSAAAGTAGYRGWFYHFVDTSTGLRVWDSELSTIDTALLLLGVHDCELFYDDAADADEQAIRTAAAALVARVDWAFMLRGDNLLSMGWMPGQGYLSWAWMGYNEAMALYLLGVGAASNPLPPAAWTAWTASYQWRTHFGFNYVWTPTGSLFTHQYSHCWVDFRGITDAHLRNSGAGIDYFENSRRATLAQQAYAATRPFANYSELEFGITACDGPDGTFGGVTYAGYAGRGAPPGRPTTLDDGTLAPTAVLGSVPFAPEACVPAARHLYNTYRAEIWSDYGFCDAFNITANRWFAPDVIGIDAGPIVLMIENHRSGALWRRLLRSPLLQRGLERAGFTAPPPEFVTSTATAPNRISVTWSDVSAFETGFQVEAAAESGAFSVVANAAANSAGASFTASPDTRYTVRVRTISAVGVSGFREVTTVRTPPAATVTQQPAPLVVTLGRGAEMSVTANGEGTLSYQWYRNGVALAGATNSTLTWASVQAGDAGNYHVAITSTHGTVTSASATLAVNPLLFPHPAGLAVDGAGNVFVADRSLHTIQRVATTRVVFAFAGLSNTAGSTDGTGTAARFNQPDGLAVASNGTVFVSDAANALIRTVSAARTVATLAGNVAQRGNTDGVGASATFSSPAGVALGPTGDLFVADTLNHTIRKVSPTGAVTTFAGVPGVAGSADGNAAAARFNQPVAVAVDGEGNVFVADQGNSTIRRISPAGVVVTLAGVPGVSGFADGSGSGALFAQPAALVVSASGMLFVADRGNSTIRRVTREGVVTTVAGLPGVSGLRDGPAAGAWFSQPAGLALAADGTLWIADAGNAALRRITAAGVVETPMLTADTSGGGSDGGGTTPPPATGGGKGGGGGAPSLGFLLALALLWLARHSARLRAGARDAHVCLKP